MNPNHPTYLNLTNTRGIQQAKQIKNCTRFPILLSANKTHIPLEGTTRDFQKVYHRSIMYEQSRKEREMAKVQGRKQMMVRLEKKVMYRLQTLDERH